MVRFNLRALVVGTSLLGALPMLAGCGHEEKKDPMMEPAKPPSQNPRPAWVNKGSGAYPGEKGKIFAVGISPAGMDDESLARETADNDGRTQMQRVFDIYIAALMEQYKRYTAQGGKGKTEIDVKSVSRRSLYRVLTIRLIVSSTQSVRRSAPRSSSTSSSASMTGRMTSISAVCVTGL